MISLPNVYAFVGRPQDLPAANGFTLDREGWSEGLRGPWADRPPEIGSVTPAEGNGHHAGWPATEASHGGRDRGAAFHRHLNPAGNSPWTINYWTVAESRTFLRSYCLPPPANDPEFLRTVSLRALPFSLGGGENKTRGSTGQLRRAIIGLPHDVVANDRRYHPT
jgi:hypothetical protein